MNFLQFLASGSSLLNFNFQAKAPSEQTQRVSQRPEKAAQGFQKITQNSLQTKSNEILRIGQPSSSYDNLSQMLQNQRQQLINRYLQLNIQLLEGKMPSQVLHKSSISQPKTQKQLQKQSASEQPSFSNKKIQNSKKKIKKVNKCGHDNKQHYAKEMCNNCYHKYGRTKKPWNCSHHQKQLYAAGMCQNCYINSYNKKRREQTEAVPNNGNEPQKSSLYSSISQLSQPALQNILLFHQQNEANQKAVADISQEKPKQNS